ncbi:DUF523 domain-containing protein [Campylobacter sp. 9BO]|uniref:DUF523 domain-containing protein n=1 Tax=Campylobacter sp. 9BO TaxID=3424759 RepID=UPI003D33541A
MKEKILISACLLGTNCKYNGGNNLKQELMPNLKALKEEFELIALCPEELGGLSTPREPAEIVGKKVITKFSRTDVSEQFLMGAKICVNIAQQNGCKIAILKERSPSCGVYQIYNGSFDKKLAVGQGLTTRRLSAAGVKIYSEDEICKVI